MSTQIGHNSQVSSEVYRKQLLSHILHIDGFERLIDDSRNPAWPASVKFSANAIASAKRLIGAFPMNELRLARQHYNSLHLLAFWRYYNSIVKDGIAAGILTERFPLFAVSHDPVRQQMSLQPVAEAGLGTGSYRAIPGDRLSFEFIPDSDYGARAATLQQADVLLSLHGRLAYLFTLAQRTFTATYNQFLIQERSAKSVLWEAYQIHIFFNLFLYKPDEPGFGQSKFDHIFFGSNLNELIIFLRHAMESGIAVDLEHVQSFLKRQTKYYLRLSQLISLEDNDLLNRHKEYLRYDEKQGVVRMADAPVDLTEPVRQLFRKTLQLENLGCPFGRIRGLETNALMEIYDYFDNLFVRVLENAWEFKQWM